MGIPSGAVQIRRAGPGDIEPLLALRTEMLRELHAPGRADPAELKRPTRAYFVRAIPAGQYVAWLAESGGEAVGCLGLAIFDRPPRESSGATGEGRILDVYTRPAWRGRGIAARLLDRAVDHARRARLRRLHLRARRAATGLYERAGFVPVAREMELRLGAGPAPEP